MFTVIISDGADKQANRRISIPSERAQQADVGELDVIHYQPAGDDGSDKQSQKTASVKAPSEKAPSEKTPSERGSVKPASSIRTKSPAKSLAAGSIPGDTERADVKSVAGKSGVSFKDDQVELQEDDFQKALATLERVSKQG